MDEAHLRSLELFEGLSKRDRGRMAELADVVDVPAGKDLVREDKFAYEFFVIEEGSAEALAATAATWRTSGPATASARWRSSTTCAGTPAS